MHNIVPTRPRKKPKTDKKKNFTALLYCIHYSLDQCTYKVILDEEIFLR
jgi:hypothetical protein